MTCCALPIQVRTYSAGIGRVAFEQDELNYDAILRNLELIGEAATHVPAEVREQHAGIPWRRVIATRNRLIHRHLGLQSRLSRSPLLMKSKAVGEVVDRHRSYLSSSLGVREIYGLASRYSATAW